MKQLPQKRKQEDTNLMEPLWTAADVSRYLRITEATVRVMARTKQIPALKVGRQWRFQPDDLRNLPNRRGAEL